MRKLFVLFAATSFFATQTAFAQVEGEAPDTVPHHNGGEGPAKAGATPLDYKTGIVPKSGRARKNGYANAIPWSWQPTRYQQVYRGDELPPVLVMSYMSFRNNLRSDTGNTVDAEIKLGLTTFDESNITSIFANNWKAQTTPTTVFTRKKISVPNMVPNLEPGSFHFEIKFDRVFPWRRVAGTNLLTEIVVHGNNNNNANYFYYLNCESQSTTTRIYATPNVTATSGVVSRGYGLVTRFHQTSEAKRKIGKVARYGKGCAGTGTGPSKNCITANPTQSTISNGTLLQPRVFVMECIAPADTTITAAEFFASAGASTSMTIQFYRASGPRPAASPVATATTTVGTSAAWVRAKFAKPIPVVDGERFYVGFVTFAGLNIIGTTGERPRYFWNGPNWFGPWNAFEFSYRIECATPTAIPAIRGTEEPTINCSHEIGLAHAKAKSPALLWIGAQRVNIDLGAALGATGCTLLTSLDIVLSAVTDAKGALNFKFNIPNDKKLIGAKIPHQWAVLDRGANRFGFVFTRGQEMEIGGL